MDGREGVGVGVLRRGYGLGSWVGVSWGLTCVYLHLVLGVVHGLCDPADHWCGDTGEGLSGGQ